MLMQETKTIQRRNNLSGRTVAQSFPGLEITLKGIIHPQI